jgi:hypothetical protein
MAFYVNGGGIPEFFPIKTTVGTIMVAFDVAGYRTVWKAVTTGLGVGWYVSAGSGFYISNDLPNGMEDADLNYIGGQTVSLNIVGGVFANVNTSVSVTYTVFANGIPSYKTTRQVGASGFALSGCDVTTTVTPVNDDEITNFLLGPPGSSAMFASRSRSFPQRPGQFPARRPF